MLASEGSQEISTLAGPVLLSPTSKRFHKWELGFQFIMLELKG